MVKSDHWIESAKIVYQFPVHFTIEVKEFRIVTSVSVIAIIQSYQAWKYWINFAVSSDINTWENTYLFCLTMREWIKTLISQLMKLVRN